MDVVLAQLPVPRMAALAASGNVPLAAGSLAVAARTELGAAARVRVVGPEVTDTLGDTLLADVLAAGEPAVLVSVSSSAPVSAWLPTSSPTSPTRSPSSVTRPCPR